MHFAVKEELKVIEICLDNDLIRHVTGGGTDGKKRLGSFQIHMDLLRPEVLEHTENL